jgi:flagella basal body P-ring formation protein FlgA
MTSPLACFAVFAGTFLHVASAVAQAVPVGAHRVHSDALAAAAANVLGAPASALRVDVVGAAPSDVDSVAVQDGGSDRWLATFWGQGGTVRRFVRIEARTLVPVAARRIERDAQLGPDDVRWEERFLPASAGVREIRDPVGMVATRVLPDGTLLVPPAVQAPLWVRGGEEVDAVMRGSGFVIAVRAEALGSARAGGLLEVRLSSGKRVPASVVGPGRVVLFPGGR